MEPLKINISFKYASMEELRAAEPYKAKAIENFIPNLLAEHFKNKRGDNECLGIAGS